VRDRAFFCHNTEDRQTTYHDNNRTMQWNCNVRLKSTKKCDSYVPNKVVPFSDTFVQYEWQYNV